MPTRHFTITATTFEAAGPLVMLDFHIAILCIRIAKQSFGSYSSVCLSLQGIRIMHTIEHLNARNRVTELPAPRPETSGKSSKAPPSIVLAQLCIAFFGSTNVSSSIMHSTRLRAAFARSTLYSSRSCLVLRAFGKKRALPLPFFASWPLSFGPFAEQMGEGKTSRKTRPKKTSSY